MSTQQKPLILVVDDLPDNIELLGAILEGAYEVKFSLNGPQALEIAAANPQPDLVLLDIMMPGMDGFQVCRLLKENPLTQKIPVIFVTAKNEDYDEARGFMLGAVDYITKPVSKMVVRARVKTHLELKESLSTLEKQKSVLEENLRLREEIERISRHDLKSPLTALINIPQMLMKDKNQTPEQIELLEILRKSARRLLEMINRSLDLFKMERGLYSLNLNQVDLATVIQQIYAEQEFLARSKNIECRLLVNGAPANKETGFLVQGEEYLFYAMLANLIKNAIEASPEGGEVVVSLSSEKEWLMEIRNQGLIPAAIRERFLEKYVTFGKEGGTGLGVYSAHLMARTLGGTLEFQSTPEAGTVLSVRLPKPQKGVSEIFGENGAGASSRVTEGLRVLVVDDYDYIRRLISKILQEMGFREILEATNGEEAGKIMKEKTPDIVLCDWNLPGENGLEICRNLRTLDAGKTIPFLLITGNSTRSELQNAVNADISAIIPKPFSPDLLRKEILQALQGKKESAVAKPNLESAAKRVGSL